MDVFEQGFDKAWAQAKEEAAAIRLSASCKACTPAYTVPQLCSYGALRSVETMRGSEYRCGLALAYRMLCGVYRRSFRPSGVKGKLDKKAAGLATAFFTVWCGIRWERVPPFP